MSDRATFELRGRIVRDLVRYGGTAFIEPYFNALSDAGVFNREHPAIAIPNPRKILATYPTSCAVCAGEGSVVAQVSGTIRLSGPPAIAYEERVCARCSGSGFTGILGWGDNAITASVFPP